MRKFSIWNDMMCAGAKTYTGWGMPEKEGWLFKSPIIIDEHYWHIISHV